MQAQTNQQLQRVCAGSACECVHVSNACVACVSVCARAHVHVCPCSYIPTNRLPAGLCAVPQGIQSVSAGSIVASGGQHDGGEDLGGDDEDKEVEEEEDGEEEEEGTRGGDALNAGRGPGGGRSLSSSSSSSSSSAASGILRPGIVHRLDIGTSGLIVVAKREAAQRHLAAQFKARTVGGVAWHTGGGQHCFATMHGHQHV